MEEYDLIVIGGGSGGLASSRRAAAVYNQKVLLIENNLLGGTCVNAGCIPKKMLYNAADIHKEAQLEYKEKTHFNWNQFREKREKYISYLNNIYTQRNIKDNITVLTGTAIIKKSTLQTNREDTEDTEDSATRTECYNNVSVIVNNKEYRSDRIIIATGSRPKMTNNLAIDSLCITSNEFFKLTQVPESVIIVGSGYIAIETAFVLAEFGCKVSILSRGKGILRSFDKLIRDKVQLSLKDSNIILLENTTLENVQRCKETNRLIVNTITTVNSQIEKSTRITNEVILAIGRIPNTNEIEIPEIINTLTPEGFIATNNTFSTKVDGIYAIGDITMNKYMLTPMAIASGRQLIDYLYDKQALKTDLKDNLIKSVPTVIFSHPPAGSVGYSEEECAMYLDSLSPKETVKTLLLEIPTVQNASMTKGHKNSYKFVFSQETSILHGIHIHGSGCDEMLQGLAVLVRNQKKMCDILEYFSSIGLSPEEYFSEGLFSTRSI
ncbi:glutathione reductase (NADPH) [Nematocida sp. AWRm80]|nr:glutathione reductase (NADPH) [Nematocida sp. AWRm80]